jgi:uncharacterized DUF497 family protein
MEFEWDELKARSNLNKHGVSFAEATAVFGDTFAMTFDDPDHSDEERRFLTIGQSTMALFSSWRTPTETAEFAS